MTEKTEVSCTLSQSLYEESFKMETMLVFLTLSVFIFGGIVIVQLYVLQKKRKEIDMTRRRLEDMLVRDCGDAISRYRMRFLRVPKTDVGYLTRVKLSHEANMPEFYLAFGGNDILGGLGKEALVRELALYPRDLRKDIVLFLCQAGQLFFDVDKVAHRHIDLGRGCDDRYHRCGVGRDFI